MSPDFDYEARLPLVQRLDVVLKGMPVSIDYWAMVWMSDLESLRARVEQLEQIPDLRLREMAVLGEPEFSSINRYIIAPWTMKKRPRTTLSAMATPTAAPPTAATPTGSPSHKRVKTMHVPSSSMASSPPGTPTKASRDAKLRAQAYERDNGCIISKVAHVKNVHMAHIYPFSMSPYIDLTSTTISETTREVTWSYLEWFYPKSEIDLWKNALLQPGQTERLENVITMAPSVHHAWDTCQFALFPISAESAGEKDIQVQFFWLKIRPRTARDMISLTQVPDIPSDHPAGLGGLLFLNSQTRQILKSGDSITLTTPDPVRFPLPSVELLRMQWHLNRIAALAGGADAADFVVPNDFDDDSMENFGDEYAEEDF